MSQNRMKALQKAQRASESYAGRPKRSLREVETLFIEKLQEKYQLNQREIKRAFSKFDMDGSGFLDLGEMTKMISGFLNGVDSAVILELVRRYDVDGDGAISLDEFQKMLLSRGSQNPSDWITIDNLTAGGGGGCRAGGVDEGEASVLQRPASTSSVIPSGSIDAGYKGKILLQNLKASLMKLARSKISEGKVDKSQRFQLKAQDLLETVAADILIAAIEPYVRSSRSKSSGGMISGISFRNFARVFSKFANPGAPTPSRTALKSVFENCRMDDGGNISDDDDDGSFADPMQFVQVVFDKGSVIINRFGFAQQQAAVSDTKRPEVGTGPIVVPEDISLLDIFKIPYRYKTRHSRTSLATPSDFDVSIAVRSSKPPNYSLKLSHVFGVSCGLMTNGALRALSQDVILYCSAAVGIIHNLANNTQQFLQGHTDDISCMAISRCRRYIATGQVGKYGNVRLWSVSPNLSSDDIRASVVIDGGFFDRAVCALAFSPNAEYICAVGCDDHHAIGIFRVSTGALVADSACCNGHPGILKSIAWASTPSHCHFISKEQQGLSDLICTAGDRHLKFWSFSRPGSSSPGSLMGRAGRLGKQISEHAKSYLSVTFPDFTSTQPIANGSADLYAAGDDGGVYLFRECVCILRIAAFTSSSIRITVLSVIGNYLFCGGSKGQISVISLGDQISLMKINTLELDTSRQQGLSRSSARMPTAGFKAKTTGPLPSDAEIQTSMKPRKLGEVQARMAKVAWGGPKDVSSDRAVPIPDAATVSSDIIGIAVFPSAQTKKNTSLQDTQVLVASALGKMYRVVLPGSSSSSPKLSTELYYHYGPVYALGTHFISGKPVIISGGDDQLISLWDCTKRCLLARTKALAPLRCGDFHKQSGKFVVVGMVGGIISMYYIDVKKQESQIPFDRSDVDATYSLKFSASRRDCDRDISDVKFSPNGKMLAVGSHDGYIDLYTLHLSGVGPESVDLKPIKRLKGHRSYVTHVDWSADNRLLQSTCGGYELLFWSATEGAQILSKDDNVEADSEWDTHTCPLGFHVMGMRPSASDGTDLNTVDICQRRGIMVTGDDFGYLKLFNFPCVAKDAPYAIGRGHSSHVMNAKFISDSSVATAGGNDCSIMLWNVDRKSGGRCGVTV